MKAIYKSRSILKISCHLQFNASELRAFLNNVINRHKDPGFFLISHWFNYIRRISFLDEILYEALTESNETMRERRSGSISNSRFYCFQVHAHTHRRERAHTREIKRSRLWSFRAPAIVFHFNNYNYLARFKTRALWVVMHRSLQKFTFSPT